MSTLGSNGRFGNQIFQYAFLRLYAQQHGMTVQTPPWIGQLLFGHRDPLVERRLPMFFDQNGARTILDKLPNAVKNVDVFGYCQYHTRYFAAHREAFCSLYEPVSAFRQPLEDALSRLSPRGETIVAVHLRRGDFVERGFVTPVNWYREWLEANWSQWDRPRLYLASDDLENVLPLFREHCPLTCHDLNFSIAGADFYPDFFVLTQSDAVAISNSTFSFAASMLNSRGRRFARPVLAASALVPFDPWDSDPLLPEPSVDTKYYEKVYESTLIALDRHRREGSEASRLALKAVRAEIADNWLGTADALLAFTYATPLGDALRMIALGGSDAIGRDPDDTARAANVIEHLRDGLDATWAIQHLLAGMLYCSPGELPLEHDLDALPPWLVHDYLSYLRKR
jgi:hypothetical protein